MVLVMRAGTVVRGDACPIPFRIAFYSDRSGVVPSIVSSVTTTVIVAAPARNSRDGRSKKQECQEKECFHDYTPT